MKLTLAQLAEKIGAEVVGDGEAQVGGELSRVLDEAGVRRHDHQVLEAEALDIRGQERPRVEMVHRLLEEALDLRGVEVHRDDPVRPRQLDALGDDPRPY